MSKAFEISGTTLCRYRGSGDHIVIPKGVTRIGSKAFLNCWHLKSVSIPEGVTEIRSQAFDGCMSLESVSIPDTVEIIGHEAFAECSSLRSVDIPDTVKTIGYNAFCGCTSLRSISVPWGVDPDELWLAIDGPLVTRRPPHASGAPAPDAVAGIRSADRMEDFIEGMEKALEETTVAHRSGMRMTGPVAPDATTPGIGI